MKAVESDCVKSARKAKDKLHKACERPSEICEWTLHRQENAHGKHERVTGQSMINSSQHTSTVTCTAALRVWHFSAFHSHLSYYCYAMGGKLIHILNFECEAHSHLSYYCYARFSNLSYYCEAHSPFYAMSVKLIHTWTPWVWSSFTFKITSVRLINTWVGAHG